MGDKEDKARPNEGKAKPPGRFSSFTPNQPVKRGVPVMPSPTPGRGNTSSRLAKTVGSPGYAVPPRGPGQGLGSRKGSKEKPSGGTFASMGSARGKFSSSGKMFSSAKDDGHAGRGGRRKYGGVESRRPHTSRESSRSTPLAPYIPSLLVGLTGAVSTAGTDAGSTADSVKLTRTTSYGSATARDREMVGSFASTAVGIDDASKLPRGTSGRKGLGTMHGFVRATSPRTEQLPMPTKGNYSRRATRPMPAAPGSSHVSAAAGHPMQRRDSIDVYSKRNTSPAHLPPRGWGSPKTAVAGSDSVTPPAALTGLKLAHAVPVALKSAKTTDYDSPRHRKRAQVGVHVDATTASRVIAPPAFHIDEGASVSPPDAGAGGASGVRRQIPGETMATSTSPPVDLQIVGAVSPSRKYGVAAAPYHHAVAGANSARTNPVSPAITSPASPSTPLPVSAFSTIDRRSSPQSAPHGSPRRTPRPKGPSVPSRPGSPNACLQCMPGSPATSSTHRSPAQRVTTPRAASGSPLRPLSAQNARSPPRGNSATPGGHRGETSAPRGGGTRRSASASMVPKGEGGQEVLRGETYSVDVVKQLLKQERARVAAEYEQNRDAAVARVLETERQAWLEHVRTAQKPDIDFIRHLLEHERQRMSSGSGNSGRESSDPSTPLAHRSSSKFLDTTGEREQLEAALKSVVQDDQRQDMALGARICDESVGALSQESRAVLQHVVAAERVRLVAELEAQKVVEIAAVKAAEEARMAELRASLQQTRNDSPSCTTAELASISQMEQHDEGQPDSRLETTSPVRSSTVPEPPGTPSMSSVSQSVIQQALEEERIRLLEELKREKEEEVKKYAATQRAELEKKFSAEKQLWMTDMQAHFEEEWSKIVSAVQEKDKRIAELEAIARLATPADSDFLSGSEAALSGSLLVDHHREKKKEKVSQYVQENLTHNKQEELGAVDDELDHLLGVAAAVLSTSSPASSGRVRSPPQPTISPRRASTSLVSTEGSPVEMCIITD
eukprot:TRINITY_DN3927_c0_g3_i1.p1 TRINITY_DN3927_c0_g3~~TRINITY_DN3927_c0_g3_i1.p1  ORF type:complete len:1010 (+),score=197.49 TRINITY_DN3927_c0_g3_i1:43-3072(+)